MLDTNIISRLAPGKPAVEAGFEAWIREKGVAGNLYLSAMTVAEIERGVRKLHRAGGVDRARLITLWLDRLLDDFGDRILPMNAVVARIAGVMEEDATRRGHTPGLADLIIAATARAYDLTLVTDNLKDFEPLDVRMVSRPV
ncbi:type II toxin-antitoxin system VapC family toxin [Hoeflea olei]|uniref:type II toxin-antitoxin system VapC family toxin n=1 Tax=Hoeflea olei TaxID=1480615 RepID=UPI001FDA329B|nr:type II toxin-antitoxin system VapC family toxin [Hoeflea olei]